MAMVKFAEKDPPVTENNFRGEVKKHELLSN